jgi:ammonium transporter, Amt family
MSEEMLLVGDDAVHGEDAYAFSDLPPNILYGDSERVPTSGDLESPTPAGKNPANNDTNGDSGQDPPKGG